MNDELEYYGLVYRAWNFFDHRVYVGQTVRSLNGRKKQHLNCAKKCGHFPSAIRKFGYEVFSWKVCEKVFVQKSWSEEKKARFLTKREKHWMDKVYKSRDKRFGYNVREAGSKGSMSEETKRKLSRINSGINHPQWKGDLRIRKIRRPKGVALKEHWTNIENRRLQSDRMKEYYRRNPKTLKQRSTGQEIVQDMEAISLP